MKRKREKAWMRQRRSRSTGAGRPTVRRECGGCIGCCRALEVPWLEKPPYVACEHAVEGVGCGIYETRPKECGLFKCAWLDAPKGMEFLTEDDRPDKLGVMLVTKGQVDGYNLVQLWELVPDALKSERVRSIVAHLRAKKCLITETRPAPNGKGKSEKLITPTIDGKAVMLRAQSWDDPDNPTLLFGQ